MADVTIALQGFLAMPTITCMSDTPMSGAFAALLRALNGHAKLAYLGVTALAVIVSAGFVLKLGVDDWFGRVTRAAALAPQHEAWIDEHDAWSKQRNAAFAQGIADLSRETAVLRLQADDNKELTELGFEQVIGLLARMERRMETVDARLFAIQGQLRTQTNETNGGLGK